MLIPYIFFRHRVPKNNILAHNLVIEVAEMSSPPEPARTEDRLERCRLCLNPCAGLVVSIENQELRDKLEKVFYFSIKTMEQLPDGVCEHCTMVIQQFYEITEHTRSQQDQMVSRLTADPEKSKTDGDSSDAGDKEPKSNQLASKTAPRSHLSNMHSDKYQRMICDTCGKGFLNKTWLEYHVKEHIGIRCHTCHKWVKGREALLEHIWVEHYENQERVCDICEKICLNATALRNHQRNVHEKTLVCEFCGKQYKQARHLSKHRATHTGQLLYTCEFCNRVIKFKSNLSQHRRTCQKKTQKAKKKTKKGKLTTAGKAPQKD